jgi:hypothetical protein
MLLGDSSIAGRIEIWKVLRDGSESKKGEETCKGPRGARKHVGTGSARSKALYAEDWAPRMVAVKTKTVNGELDTRRARTTMPRGVSRVTTRDMKRIPEISTVEIMIKGFEDLLDRYHEVLTGH